MLYYITLFLVIVLVSISSVWVCRAIIGIGRAARIAILPDSKKISTKVKAKSKARKKVRAKVKGNTKPAGGFDIPTPWGWRDEAHSVHSEHTQSVIMKPGSDRKLWTGQAAVNETYAGYSQSSKHAHASDYTKPTQKTPKPQVGWPYREDKMAFAGKAYKVNRKVTDDAAVIADGKPWVW